MKWMKAVLCSVLLGVTGAAVSGDEAREKPLDYMQGVMLETTGASPWYRVELSPLLYQGTAWPTCAMCGYLTIRERPYRSRCRCRRRSRYA